MGGSIDRALVAHPLSAPSLRLSELLARLNDRLDKNAVVTGPDVGDAYCADATDERGARPSILFRPRDTASVSAILSACDALRQPIVVQGGRTGLAGAARPMAGEVALSLERMSAIEPVNDDAGTVIAHAGATLQAVQEAAASHGFLFGVDIGARGTSTIGGNIATNAGGIRVLRYGMYRAQVLGLEAVMADGSVLTSLKGLSKDNSGFDLNQIFIGSEGTLGVVTRACLRLHPKPQSLANAFCALPSLSAAIALLRRLRQSLGPSLSAFEVIFPAVYAGVLNRTGAPPPVPAGAGMYALIEMQGQDEAGDEDRFAAALMECYEDGIVSDVAISRSLRDYHAIWALREAASEFIFSMDHVAGFDVSLPISAMQRFLDRATAEIATVDPAASIYIFGHLGDGNLHFLVRTHHYDRVADVTYSCVANEGGSISAEHGIGLEKKKWLALVRSPTEMAAMRRLKSAFDPNNILNPGRVFDMEPTTPGERA
ncbi:FAD-binding oxidoreductase [Rhizobium sp. RCC_161_2]|uniref:FAD-binding oxidoreductase n=1 Tax=Rhizobium sp. RCC_161_2 TaxID=3239219 RepID=UPI00352570CE